MNGAGTGTGDYSFPFGQVLGGVLDAYGTNQYRQDLLGIMNKSRRAYALHKNRIVSDIQ